MKTERLPPLLLFQITPSGKVEIARRLGVSELVVGLTIVAGSNIFNVLLILGLCALLHPMEIERSAAARDIGAMLLASFALVPIMRTGFVISRSEGAVLLGAYV